MKALKDVAVDDSWIAHNITKKFMRKKFPHLANAAFELGKTTALCDQCQTEEAVIHLWRLEGNQEWQAPHGDLNQCRSCFEKEKDKEIQDILQNQTKDHGQQIQSRLIKDYWIIPKDLERAGFKNYQETNPTTTNAKREAIRYVREFRDTAGNLNTNLLLMGGVGTGKSHLCVSIGRTLLDEGYSVGFLTTGTLLTKIKATYQKGSSQSEEDIMNDIEQLTLLILDDIGSESGSKSEFDWSKKTLFEIVNRRIGRPTIYTSNFNDLELGEAVGKRTFSRLYTNTKFIDVFTDDFRRAMRIQ